MTHYSSAVQHEKSFWELYWHCSARSTKMHTQDFYEFFLTVTDDIVYELNGDNIRLPGGALIFSNPSDVHDLSYDKNGIYEYINLSFTTEEFKRTLRYLKADDKLDYFNSGFRLVRLSENQTNQLAEKMRKLKLPKGVDKSEYDNYVRAIMTEVIGCYFLRNERRSENMPEWLAETCNWVQDGLNFALSLDEIAQHSGCTKEHFCRSIRKYKNVTAMQYINNIRLDYVATMLEISDKPIIELWSTAGFFSGSHFNRLFKERYQMTAREYRKSKY